ncbi:MAG TPA: hypothetical protein VHX64_11845, partial [Caulobacteraceae bacterium]|nr:hypothetical protein [Caulobacteraceae bacterium]
MIAARVRHRIQPAVAQAGELVLQRGPRDLLPSAHRRKARARAGREVSLGAAILALSVLAD